MKRRMTMRSTLSETLLLVLISFPLVCCKGLPREHVEAWEANHPWLVFELPAEGSALPYGDKEDPSIIYLVYTTGSYNGKPGDAVKINLSTKETTPYHFNVTEWEDAIKYTLDYSNGLRRHSSDGPIWVEFRGKREDRIVKHMFGDPVANKLGTYKAEMRTGYYYIMDERNAKPIELLRVKIANSEMDFGELGSACLSPDRKWIVFVTSRTFELYKQPSKAFVFKRDGNNIFDFQNDHNDPTLERW